MPAKGQDAMPNSYFLARLIRIRLPQLVIAIGNRMFARHATIIAGAVAIMLAGAWLSFVGNFA